MRFLPVALVVVLLGATSIARADVGDAALAQALFEEGKRLMEAHLYAEACPKLADSQKLDPGTGTLLNLAVCYERLGRTATAWATFKSAAAAARANGETQREGYARAQAARLEPTLPTVTVVVSPGARAPGLEVLLDGEAVPETAWGAAVPVDEGDHAVGATAPGRRPWSETAHVGGAGSATSVTVPPLAETSSAPAPEAQRPAGPAAPAASSPPWRTVGIIAAGVGGAGLIAGSVFGVLAKSNLDASQRDGCSGNACGAGTTGIGEHRTAGSDATASTVLFVAGSVLAAAGVTLWVLAPGRSDTTSVGVAAAPGGAFLSWRGAW